MESISDRAAACRERQRRLGPRARRTCTGITPALPGLPADAEPDAPGAGRVHCHGAPVARAHVAGRCNAITAMRESAPVRAHAGGMRQVAALAAPARSRPLPDVRSALLSAKNQPSEGLNNARWCDVLLPLLMLFDEEVGEARG